MAEFFEEARELFEYTQLLRRDFHRNPELGFHETRTAGIVVRELQSLGIEVATGIAQTGVVALLEGAHPGPVVLVRFDMDALPILEETQAEYASTQPGVMHACGHDGHVAIGLTVARLLNAHRQEFDGTVKFIFQPAEEGMGGAEKMVAEGILENPKPDVALAAHVWNDRPVGWVGISSGPVMAAAEYFALRVTGKGGHGANPHLAIDPVAASAQIITALQNIVSRNVSPLETAVVTVASIKGGEAFNVIPPFVDMKGTIRTFDPEVREMVIGRFKETVKDVSAAMGCQVKIELHPLTPAVTNDAEISRQVERVAIKSLPVTVDKNFRTMGSEDMAVILQKIPGCFIFVGSANAEKGLNAPHHHPNFDIDEAALPIAAALLSSAVVDFLKPQ